MKKQIKIGEFHIKRCPICFNTDLKIKDGKLFCTKCNILIDNYITKSQIKRLRIQINKK